MNEQFTTALRTVVESSSNLTNLTLALLGGTLAVLMTTKYLRLTGNFKFTYLLFLPGWAFLGLSLWKGDDISTRFLALLFAKESEKAVAIGKLINSAYGEQRNCFLISLVFFGVWLLTFVLWLVFSKDQNASADQTGKKDSATAST